MESWVRDGKGDWGLEFLGLREEGAGSLDSWLHEICLQAWPPGTIEAKRWVLA